MRLVGDDDDVIPFRVGFFGLDLFVKFLDQRKYESLVLAQQLLQMLTTGGTARVAVVIHNAAPAEGFVDLGVQVLAVGQHDKGVVAAQFAVNFPSEEHNRIGLS
ncbi:hypothetical protein D3C77_554020 [compost metagenome]